MMSIGKCSLDWHQVSHSRFRHRRSTSRYNMKYTAILFCLAATAIAAKAASVSGVASIDRNSIAAQARLIFPRIPGLNAPLRSIIPSRQTTTTTTSSPSSSTSPSSNPSNSTSPSSNPSNSTSPSSNPSNSTSPSSNPSNTASSSSNGQSPLSNIASLFDIPDPASLIPKIASPGNSSGIEVPQLPGLPDLSQLPRIPGLSEAIQSARNHVQAALKLGTDIPNGIQQAIQEALESDDPTSAIRTIIRTIIDAYVTVASNCPLMIVGSRVIQEGIRLAVEAAKSARNIIFGTTSAPI